MKHLKLFEEIEIDLSKYDRYILSLQDDIYYIDEILGWSDTNGKVVDIINYYTYRNDKLIKNYQIDNFGNEVFGEKDTLRRGFLKNCVIYTSDSLEDCIKMIEIYKETNDFNL